MSDNSGNRPRHPRSCLFRRPRLSHLPPIPAGLAIAIAVALLLVKLIITAATRRVKREMGRQLRQAFVAGLAAGSATGWAVGSRRQRATVHRLHRGPGNHPE